MKFLHPISVIITTFNEESHIEACIDSVAWANEIIIVDSFSDDKTIEIAKSKNVVIHQRKYISPSDQKNWAIIQAKYDWVLILDADETVSDQLSKKIQFILNQNIINEDLFWIARQNYFLGKKINYSGWQNDKVIRLIRKEKGRYNDKQVHEEIITTGLNVGYIAEKLNHYTYKSMHHFLAKMDRYAQWSAQDYAHKTKKVGFFQIVFKPFYRFVQHFILKFGFLDGMIGFIISAIMAWGVFLRYLYLLELKNKK